MKLYEAAKSYIKQKLCVLAASRDKKFPTVGKWTPYRNRLPCENEIDAWFANNPDAVCIVCGEVSGNLEIIDFDQQGELFEAWWEKVDDELRRKVVIETTQSGGWHVVYRCEDKISGNLKLAQRKVDDKIQTLIETRGEGGLFLCSPTDGYELMQGSFTALPVLTSESRQSLLEAAWELNEYVPDENIPNTSSEDSCLDFTNNLLRPGDDFNQRGGISDVLEKYGWQYVNTHGDNQRWRRPGKSKGWSATLRTTDNLFYVFSSNAAVFESGKAYSPFTVYTILEHNGDFTESTRTLAQLGYGQQNLADSQVDISKIIDKPQVTLQTDTHDTANELIDPGHIPEHMFIIPGFIGEVVDFCLKAAPYPNLAMAFCGALALQSHLCARKVREPGDLRTNIYILSLTGSSGGKNFPRNVNTHVLTSIGQARCLGDKFASGEGIQDELNRHQAKLYQNDEIDGLIQAVNKSRDGRMESIMSTLLTMFTSANTIYPMRSKAGKEDAGFIDQPHLTIFGTATPTYYYEALSERMLTNGFFARMIIVDVGKRPKGQEPQPVSDMPQRIIDTAKWWHELQPGAFAGNLSNFHPEPKVVPYSDKAKDLLGEFRRKADIEYGLAEDSNDEVAKTVWGRANENARKLAMLYACSANHEQPQIDIDAAQWAMAFIDHQVRRMLYMAGQYVSSGEFDAECKKLLRKLNKKPDRRMEHSVLLKRMKIKAKDFKDIIETLVQRGDIEIITTQTKGRPNLEYAVKEVLKCP